MSNERLIYIAGSTVFTYTNKTMFEKVRPHMTKSFCDVCIKETDGVFTVIKNRFGEDCAMAYTFDDILKFVEVEFEDNGHLTGVKLPRFIRTIHFDSPEDFRSYCTEARENAYQ